MKTTQAGIPITRCGTCDFEHPVTRLHCIDCGIASGFLNDDIRCTGCAKAVAA